LHRPAIRHRPAAHRRRDHPADPAHGGDRPLHPLVPYLGIGRRLGGGNGMGPDNTLRNSQPHHRQATLRWIRASPEQTISSRLAPLPQLPMQIYVGFVALIGNLVAAILITIVLRRMRVFNGTDETNPGDYHEDDGSPRLRPVASMLR